MTAPNLRNESRPALLWRQAKVTTLQAVRLAQHLRHPDRFAPPRLAHGEFPHLHGRREVELGRHDASAHPLFEAGKRWNLQLAAPAFDGLELTPDRTLSFWRTLGRVTAARGFRHGMELRGGCIVPALGGGLCLLANALFELAVRLGWRIDERHGHTLEAVPPDPGLWGLDATVFWPYVDLRVTPRAEARLHVAVVQDRLVLEVHGRQALDVRVELAALDDRVSVGPERVRTNRIVRTTTELATGRVLHHSDVAVNRKRLLHDAERARNCLTCGEMACAARVVVPAGEWRQRSGA